MAITRGPTATAAQLAQARADAAEWRTRERAAEEQLAALQARVNAGPAPELAEQVARGDRAEQAIAALELSARRHEIARQYNVPPELLADTPEDQLEDRAERAARWLADERERIEREQTPGEPPRRRNGVAAGPPISEEPNPKAMDEFIRKGFRPWS